MAACNGNTRPSWSIQLEDAIRQHGGTSTTPTGTGPCILATLATTRQKPDNLRGRPSCRTVNVRQFDGTALTFISDMRSDKIPDDDINRMNTAATDAKPVFASTKGELCIYVGAAHVQFRLSGTLNAYTANSNEDGVDIDVPAWWNVLTQREKSWFMWPHPGTPLDDQQHAETALNANGANDDPAKPPSHFCMCRLLPDFVDVLHLGDFPYTRVRYTLDEQASKWSAVPVNF